MRGVVGVLIVAVLALGGVGLAEDAAGTDDPQQMLERAGKFANAAVNSLAAAEYLLGEIVRLHPDSPESEDAEEKLAWIREVKLLAMDIPASKQHAPATGNAEWMRNLSARNPQEEAALAAAEKALGENTYESLHDAAFKCRAFLIQRPDAENAWKVRQLFDAVDAKLRNMTGQPARKTLGRNAWAEKFRVGGSMESLIDLAASKNGDAVPSASETGRGVDVDAGVFSLEEPTYELLVIPGE